MLIRTSDISTSPKEWTEAEKDFIIQLAESIKTKGLLHPITTHKVDKGWALIAGLKRLEACKLLGLESLECKEVTDISPEALLELHIHENLMRDNLPWYEVVELERQLHELRQAKHGKPVNVGGTLGYDGGWSLRDTAKELQMAFGTLSEDLKLAEALSKDPMLAKIKDKKTALRMVRQSLRRAESEMASQGTSKVEPNTIYLANSLDILSRFPPSTFDACVTDPPWLRFQQSSHQNAIVDDDIVLTRDEDTLKIFGEIYRTLKFDTMLYAFVGTDDFYMYREELPKFGFQVQSHPVLWHKPNVVTMGRRGWEHTRDIEQIIVAAKGNPLLTERGNVSSVITQAAIPGPLLKHPNEKHINVVKRLVSLCTWENGLILDPFAGVGTIPRACKSLGRRYVAIERVHKYYKIMEEALK